MGVKYPKASKSAEIPPFLSVFTFSTPIIPLGFYKHPT